jgi:uncharacterized membrane protein
LLQVVTNTSIMNEFILIRIKGWFMALSQKTWLPQLAKIAQRLCAYIRRYEEKIKAPMTDEQKAIVDAALLACSALDVLIAVLLPPDN